MGRPDDDNEEVKPIVLSASAESMQHSSILSASTPITTEKKDDIVDEIREGTYNVGDVGEDEVEDTEDVVDGRLLTGQNYEVPKDEDKFIDTSKGELIDKSKLTEFDVIKAVAKQTGTEIRNPRPSCKHCYGRGWIGRDSKTQAPVPCNCIYPYKTPDQLRQEELKDQKNVPKVLNKQTMKQLRKVMKAEKKIINKQKIQEEQRLQDIEGNKDA